MTAYRSGTGFEHRVRTKLRMHGYTVVRSAASKTKIDLVAMGDGVTLLIQCKRDGVISVADWNAVWQTAQRAAWGTVPLLAAAGPGGHGIKFTEMLGPAVPWQTRPSRPWLPDDQHGHRERQLARLEEALALERYHLRPVQAVAVGLLRRIGGFGR